MIELTEEEAKLLETILFRVIAIEFLERTISDDEMKMLIVLLSRIASVVLRCQSRPIHRKL